MGATPDRCAHCGAKAIVETRAGDTAFRVSCSNIKDCGATQYWFDSEEEAVESWNKRATVGNKEKNKPDLRGKCGSCCSSVSESGRFGRSTCYVRCTNPEHLKRISGYRNGLAAVRQRTAKGCKHYQMSEEYAEQI